MGLFFVAIPTLLWPRGSMGAHCWLAVIVFGHFEFSSDLATTLSAATGDLGRGGWSHQAPEREYGRPASAELGCRCASIKASPSSSGDDGFAEVAWDQAMKRAPNNTI